MFFSFGRRQVSIALSRKLLSVVSGVPNTHGSRVGVEAQLKIARQVSEAHLALTTSARELSEKNIFVDGHLLVNLRNCHPEPCSPLAQKLRRFGQNQSSCLCAPGLIGATGGLGCGRTGRRGLQTSGGKPCGLF